jgi:signal peptidase I
VETLILEVEHMSSDGGYPTPYPGAPRHARRALPSDWEEFPETQDFNPPDELLPVEAVPTPDPYGIEELREPTGVLRLPPLDPEADEPTVALAGYGRRTPSGTVITPQLPIAAPTVRAPVAATDGVAVGSVSLVDAQNLSATRALATAPSPVVSPAAPPFVSPDVLSDPPRPRVWPEAPPPVIQPATSAEIAAPAPQDFGPPRPHRLPRQDPRSAAVIAEAGDPTPPAKEITGGSRSVADEAGHVAGGVVETAPEVGKTDAGDSADADSGAESKQRPRWVGWLVEALIIVLGAMVLTSVLRLFVYQTFNVPTGSMEHTIDTGDSIIAVKLIDFERGDVVVFEDPGDWLRGAKPEEPTGVRKALEWVGLLPSTATRHLVKRVIGMPGDHVVCCDASGRITVNGVALVEDEYLFATNGVAVAPSDMRFDVIVPKDRIFVMGDHRNESADSRYHLCEVTDGQPPGMAAFVPIENITGTVVAVSGPWSRMGRIRIPETFENVPSPGPAPDSPSIIGPCS